MNNVSKSSKTIARLGILAAISVVLVALIHFPIIPSVSFLEYDPADIPILLGTFAMGPVCGLLLTVAVSVVQGLTVSAASGWYGIVMHIIATGTYVVVAGNIYRKHKTKKRAIFALVFGTLAMAVIMIPANLWITPLYYCMIGIYTTPQDMIIWLPPIILFNLIKAGINSFITFLVYKKISGVLHS